MHNLKLSLACAVFLVSTATYAQDDAVSLEGVTATENEERILDKKVGQTKKTAKTMQKQQTQDTRDLVKYETGISVIEKGRSGSSGYSIRGVDENRVAIQIDGLQQSETLSSQGFQELFEGYGNFNNVRNGVEIETIREATINKGADSVKSGSGSLGGSVLFQTKDARDYLTDKDYYYSYKGGVSTANEQRFHSHTMAAKFKWFDIIAVKTKRKLHEFKNYGYENFDDRMIGKEREKADPYYYKRESTLVKFGFTPHEEHRFTFTSDKSKNKTQGHDWSYAFNTDSFGGATLYGGKPTRHVNDLSKRENRSFSYENFSQTPLWDSMKISYSKQKIVNRARTDTFCAEGENCSYVTNPAGLKLDNTQGKIVDKYGGEVKMIQNPSTYRNELIDSKGNVFSDDGRYGNEKYRGYYLADVNIDCSVYDCSKGMHVYDTAANTYKHVDIIKQTAPSGKEYYTANPSQIGATDRLILPSGQGFLSSDWRQRDLNTDTKQFNLDFEKEFSTWDLEHSLSYGGIYSSSEKYMINQSGTDINQDSLRWWAKTFYGFSQKDFSSPHEPDPCYTVGKGYVAKNKCESRAEDKFSFLIPVKTKSGSIYFDDDIKINDQIAVGIGYGFNKTRYKPRYTAGETPKIPDNMVGGIWIPLPPTKWITEYIWGEKIVTPEPLPPHVIRKNAEENLAYIVSQKRAYSEHSYALSTTLDPLENFRMQLKYSRGFRMPTSDELYFTFRHPDFTVLPNFNLKPEIANTKEIALTLHDSPSFITLNLFETRYKNFIDLEYLGKVGHDNSGNLNLRNERDPSGNIISRGIKYDIHQNKNRDKAVVRGIEISSKLFLNQINPKLEGFSLGYNLSYQKGRIDGDTPMNAIQPTTQIFNVGYNAKNDKFGADLYITSVAAKNQKDSYNMYYEAQMTEYNEAKNLAASRGVPFNEKEPSKHMKWRSAGYTIFDLVGYVKPIKNLTLRAGIYNITDKRYLTWENARSIRSFGTVNLINQATGVGINRFYSPGRNFRFTFEFTF